jgi:hypothetical protein
MSGKMRAKTTVGPGTKRHVPITWPVEVDIERVVEFRTVPIRIGDQDQDTVALLEVCAADLDVSRHASHRVRHGIPSKKFFDRGTSHRGVRDDALAELGVVGKVTE